MKDSKIASHDASHAMESGRAVVVAEIEKYKFLSRPFSESTAVEPASNDLRIDADHVEALLQRPRSRRRAKTLCAIPAGITEKITGRYLRVIARRVSATHCYVMTPESLPVGANVLVHLNCEPREFNFQARVVHAKPGRGMNLAITRMETRVLLVDDSKLIREAVTRLLQMDPEMKLVGQAADGLTAQELTERVRPDVIVMDIMLPRMSGLQAARAIHEKWPDIPIILISGMNGEEYKQASELFGAGAFLPKDALCRELSPQIHRLARAAIRPAISRAISKNESAVAAAAGGRG